MFRGSGALFHKPRCTFVVFLTQMASPVTERCMGGVGVVRILLVDDNPSVRHYLRAVLEQQTSWRVCGEARTGAEALKKVMEAPPD